MPRTTRRAFLRTSAAIAAISASEHPLRALQNPQPSAALPPQTLPLWTPGTLDIHHINTGRGNSALLICPDGTSLLIDAGASNSDLKYLNAARPDATRRAGQWIGRYATRQLRAANSRELDHALITHLHPDHLGEVAPGSPVSPTGGYRLTGISDVEEEIPIRHVIDRGYPDYTYPRAFTDPSALNYIAFVRALARKGSIIERAKVGDAGQLALLKNPQAYPNFSIRTLAANGDVWTGQDAQSSPHFPPIASLSPADLPTENSCSIAIRLDYGRFSYYTGGDLTSDTSYCRDPWLDIESPATRVCGPVSVATVDHHGYYDATGPDAVRNLRARVWILQAWHASHPALSTLANLYSAQLYPGPRDVFSAGLKPEAALTTARFSDLFKSQQGHVLVRVTPPGNEYSVIVLEDKDETDRIKATFGPYAA
jgi:beta-lactamase superfamily II metal-dependent hydrolase